MRAILSIAILLGVIAVGGVYYFKYYRSEGASNFRTAQVERGRMLPTIEATGSLEPEQVVDIGSQVNGLITDLKVDYGSVVEKDTVLALIDETLYQATVDQNQASVKSAEAALKLAQANLHLAEANLTRDEQLRKTEGALPDSQYDTDKAACEVSKATVGVDQAAINQAKAMLRQGEVNLGYCKIRSPVKGTIVDRRVNVGQTVVSSLSASSLFLLAKDLSRIQVWASVNEADIGRIHEGVKVKFKVDAYPNEIFEGEVAQIRLNATMTQNVVTYTVVVTTENKEVDTPPSATASGTLPVSAGPRYKLLPYMTASLNFEIERHENVLKVPNAALRWKPRPKQIAPDIREETLAAMNRPKQTDDAKDETKGDAKDSAAGTQNAEQSQPDSKLATSGGTATGLTPEDWKARTAKNAQDGKKVAAAAPQGRKSAGGKQQPPGQPVAPQTATAQKGHQPPGRVLSPQEVKARKEHYESGRLWKADGNFVRPVPVKIIATDGTMTEVRGKDVSDGMEVVVGESVASENGDDTVNPFAFKMPGKGKAKSSGSSK